MATSSNDISVIIDRALSAFEKQLPSMEGDVYDRILESLRTLDIRNGAIRPTAANLRRVLDLQKAVDKLVTGNDYLKNLSGLLDVIGAITDAENRYYKQFFEGGKTPAIAEVIRNAARNSIIDDMTTGLSDEVFKTIQDTLNAGIISGQSYSELTDALKNVIITTDEAPGILFKYARQIATDSINGYARQYGVTVSEGLGFQWFLYAGSNIATTRDFCLACKKKRYIHISEFPKLLKGDFPEFKAVDGKIYAPYGLPQGMRKGTTPQNFRVFAGGYNCGHQLRPLYEYQVPKDIRDAYYKTPVYKAWKKENPKAI